MLLSNLTASTTPCSALLSLTIPVVPYSGSIIQVYPTQSRCGTCSAPAPYPPGDSREVLALPLLVDSFVQGAHIDPSADPTTRKRKGESHFLSSVFANLTVVCSSTREGAKHANITILDTGRPYLFLDSSLSQYIAAEWRHRISPSEACDIHGAQGYNTQRWCCFDSEVS